MSILTYLSNIIGNIELRKYFSQNRLIDMFVSKVLWRKRGH